MIMREIWWLSLKLGLQSFGGPIAHLGYFERTYVRERHWLSPEDYTGIVALCQLLPGPTSSQVGFLIGLHRGGLRGALTAWLGFTLPSALLMYVFALLTPHLTGELAHAALHGLMLAAVAVVAQAVWSMARTLCPDRERIAIALLAALLLLSQAGARMQFAAIAFGAVAGGVLRRRLPSPRLQLGTPVGTRTGIVALGLFLALLLLLPALASLGGHGPMALANVLFRSGALVFGGGHVVLPLLREALVPAGWITDGTFLEGYGLAQALPGPLFTVAVYLGAQSSPSHASILWAAIALVAIFLPGLLLATAGLSLWARYARASLAAAVIAGINAAVVGVLAAALYDPVWVSAVHGILDAAIAVAGLALLQYWRAHSAATVLWCVLASLAVTWVRSVHV
jgi:chromate transporter